LRLHAKALSKENQKARRVEWFFFDAPYALPFLAPLRENPISPTRLYVWTSGPAHKILLAMNKEKASRWLARLNRKTAGTASYRTQRCYACGLPQSGPDIPLK